MSEHSYIKAHKLRREAWPRVRARLENLRARPPSSVNVFTSWAAQRDGRGWAVVSEQSWLPWPNLAQVMAHTHPLRRIQLAEQLLGLVALWREEGFVHGDLSPRNLLVIHAEGDAPRLMAVDWVLDLESREGTPRYVPEHLAWQLKNFEHDGAAARLIAAELGHRPA